MSEVINCKRCNSSNTVKNGPLRGKQSYKCKSCKYRFVLGDSRAKLSLFDKSLIVLLYSSCKASYNLLGKLFGVSPVAIMKLIKRTSDNLPDPVVSSSIKEISFDEMWHFINEKKTRYGSGVVLSVLEIELSGGILEIVVVKHSESSSKDLSI
jgi:transposase